MASPTAADSPSSAPEARLVTELAGRLVEGALPGEVAGFDGDARDGAAALVAQALAKRTPGQPSIAHDGALVEGRRVMRLAIVNDDMPFLVDSIGAAVAAADRDIDRLLHPILAVERDADGSFTGFGGEARESVIYLEIARMDARHRTQLIADIETTLAHVRAAVSDWPAMQASLVADAARLGSSEGAAFLRWLLDRNFTQLGYARYDAEGAQLSGLGIMALGERPLSEETLTRARAWLQDNPGPLNLEAQRYALVHRRMPLDCVLTRDGDGVAMHCGLWTSAALASAPESVPLLRERLSAVMRRMGFGEGSHAGKSLAHAFRVLPHDLLLVVPAADAERLTLTAMSIGDRPRPLAALATDALARHLYALVWLPREALSTQRREAIAALIAEKADAKLISWATDVDDNGVALIRYSFDRRGAAIAADEAAISEAVVDMVRGWQPAVETALAAASEGGAATRLALRYADAFPQAYRNGAGPEEAALDILRLAALDDERARGVRLYRNADDAPNRLRLKLYSRAAVTLSAMVPVLENAGFSVIEEISTQLDGGLGQFHRFVLEPQSGDAAAVLARAGEIEPALAAVLEGRAENDRFTGLMVAGAASIAEVTLLRALFRYLRQTGQAYGLDTVAGALQRHGDITRAITRLFAARHDPAARDDGAADAIASEIERALTQVSAVDDDRILRLFKGVVLATLRTNFYAPAAAEAVALKLDSAAMGWLPAPRPWREIFVYSPRVEGIHLRAGPIARGGLRWSDRRDDFRTEVLGLLKAQRTKNAVIVPNGAKGGFYPKQLPDPAADRDAWLAEGTEAYRIFIRTLLSVTDNIVDGKVVHPESVVVRDGEDPYFVVAADKGTASFSDVANAIALERGFWLGDAFASGGSVGYDHKGMGITARGAWVSVQRHFAERGVDVQTDPIRVVGCGDMSGDVFGNGMLLSKSLKLVAAFDHRHIFIDPTPDPAVSWTERERLFRLPRSSWADYDAKLISAGGGVWPRGAKTIELSPEAQAALGIEAAVVEPSQLIAAILKAPVDLIWFGGIGTYIKAASEANGQVGDAANDAHRVDGEDVRATVIGEGANLGVTQAGRIAFSLKGGRINTDFIDNSAGVDCSDHEVNIKIALNNMVARGELTMPARNDLLAAMTDDVAALVLEDNRLQTLALSMAEREGALAIPALTRLIGTFEADGTLDRRVEGLPADDVLARRAAEGKGLTRPELAVLLSTAKIALKEAVTDCAAACDDILLDDIIASFPTAMHAEPYASAIERHQLRREMAATIVANRMINRLGIGRPFELAEEEGATLGDVAAAFIIACELYDLPALWDAIDTAPCSEAARLMLFENLAIETRAQMGDLLRNAIKGRSVSDAVATLKPPVQAIMANADGLIRDEVRRHSQEFAGRLRDVGAPDDLVQRVVRFAEMDGAVGIAALGATSGTDTQAIARAFTALGAALGIDWAQNAAMTLSPSDPWERLLAAGLSRDFQQMRLDFLARRGGAPEDGVRDWLAAQRERVEAFRATIERARHAPQRSVAMLAQVAAQARSVLTL